MPAAVVKDGTVTPKFRQGKISPPFLTAKFSPRNSPLAKFSPPLYVDMHTVASCMSKSHGCTCGSQRCRNNLKFRNTKPVVRPL